jgi:hypothetical protein
VQSSEPAHFTSEIVSSILATDSSEKSLSTLFRNSWVFSGRSGFVGKDNHSQESKITIVVKINSLGK